MIRLLFGAGNVSRQFFIQFRLLGIAIDGVVVSDVKKNPSTLLEMKVHSIFDYIDFQKEVEIFLCVSDIYKHEIKKLLRDNGFFNIWEPVLLPMEYKYFLNVSKEEFLKAWFFWRTNKTLNLEEPSTYNEKIQSFKLYGVTPLVERLCDKLAVRSWVKDSIGENYLTKIYGIWGSFDEIDFDSLPNKFVLKCNHGSGFNYIVHDKLKLDVLEARQLIDKWMDTDFSDVVGLEMQYKRIVPMIYAEEYLENENDDLYDYKFWCFGGKVRFVMFLSERHQELKMNNFTTEWEPLPFTYDYDNKDWDAIKRPVNLDEMLAVAEKLSANFPHVRVDLYQLDDGRIYFSEMTFTSNSGVCKWSDELIDQQLGDLIIY